MSKKKEFKAGDLSLHGYSLHLLEHIQKQIKQQIDEMDRNKC